MFKIHFNHVDDSGLELDGSKKKINIEFEAMLPVIPRVGEWIEIPWGEDDETMAFDVESVWHQIFPSKDGIVARVYFGTNNYIITKNEIKHLRSLGITLTVREK